MKEFLVVLCAILAVTTARVVINIEGQDTPHLLGSKACTWGPSYWCQNITTAAGCNATKHCIPKVWEKLQVPEDHDSVCQICKDMVKQARDQLESNETQEDLKTVFEGSCALIYIKPIVKECDKLVDEFIPELVETLASQMNPSVVCSVAGLCNSAHIDKLIEEYEKQSKIKKLESQMSLENDEYKPNDCSKCYTVAHHMEHKFSQTSRDKVLEQFLHICGEFSSFSDACSSIILTNFEVIYSHLQNNLNADNVCHLSGKCSYKFHIHKNATEKTPEVEIRPLSSVGMVEINDDLPCKLCEQLVGHLRDLLVANTTEAEFQQVLEGLCKQTKSFAQECKSIVDEYYPEIYAFLTKRLDGNAICQMGGLCPAPNKKSAPIWPLVPESHAKIAVRIMKESKPKVLEANEMQLPLERMSLPMFSPLFIDDKYCTSCEFVMNYVKKNVEDLKNREEVTMVLNDMKTHLPGIKEESNEENFLTKYEPAIIELVLNGKALSEICPLVAVCPTNQQIQAWEQIPGEMTEKLSVQDKPNCPLCLFAVTKLYELVKDEKTEASIEAALEKLCHELPKSLNEQCTDLVKIYSKELIDMLLKDMTPQEVCVSLQFCDRSQRANHKSKLFFQDKIVAIPQNDVEGKQACAFCEYVMHYIQQAITNPKSEDKVKKAIDKICTKLPTSVGNDCIEFINAYGDALVSIIVQEIDPTQVCPMIHLCPSTQLLEALKMIPEEHVIKTKVEDKPNCPLCLFGVTQLYNAIKDNKTEASIEAALEKLCTHLPKSLLDQCDVFVQNYSKQIIEMILADLTPQEVCVYLQLCDAEKGDVEPEITIFPLDKNGEIMTNEIPNGPMYTVNVETVEIFSGELVGDDMECTVCQFVMQYLEKAMGSRKSKDEIEHLVHNVCNHLPKHMADKCNNFVNEYAEIVIELLTQEVSPKEICTIVDLCKPDTTRIRECALCQVIVTNIEKLLVDPKTDEHIEEVMAKICKYLPENEQGKCTMLMEIYEQSIINIIKTHGDTKKICLKLGLCSANDFLIKLTVNRRTRRQTEDKNLGTKPCTWGEFYWCISDKTAEECKASELCKKKGRLSESSPTLATVVSNNIEIKSKNNENKMENEKAAVTKDISSS
ncbi:uncharacterized protein LOC131663220 isoform X2 [Phymastichus coffea]|uniref:uncharacterized protein LOC131663220 isoform X2 n=1 Tax=Phymastichus coffea TaxID=108790 RepID=UPI00273C245F|nr:uncharacterized protein LOC131663220 isoform X2 [Phymastichus coffea]